MFVDFSKAFDTVNQNYLFYSLIKSGMHRKMLQLIREVYSNVKATVHTDEGLTDYFECKLEVMQCCMLSPRLFIILINELEKMLKMSRFKGTLMGNEIEVFSLMYANDTALLGDTVIELQKKINMLEKFYDKWSMEVNLTKTQVIVFRNGGNDIQVREIYNTVKTVTYYH